MNDILGYVCVGIIAATLAFGLLLDIARLFRHRSQP